jgi:hypothetical protein
MGFVVDGAMMQDEELNSPPESDKPPQGLVEAVSLRG